MHDTIMNLFYSLVEFGTNHAGMFFIIIFLLAMIIGLFFAWGFLGLIDRLGGKK